MKAFAGWGYPTSVAKKEHWWAEDDARSGCGRYGRFMITVQATRPLDVSKICVACARKADAAGAA